MPTFTCQAILFDQDGILVDSEITCEVNWKKWGDANGVAIEDILAVHHGRPVHQTIGLVAPHLDVPTQARAFENALAADMSALETYPGVRELLPRLPAHRWAMATSAPRVLAVPRLKHLGLPVPDVVVTINDVENGKPAPDPYLLAAEKLGFEPSECLVFEDAPAGVASAKAAGATVIAVASTNPPDALREADLVVPELAGVQVEILQEGLVITAQGDLVDR